MISTSQNTLYHISNLNEESERISYQMSTGENQYLGSEDSILYSDLIELDDRLRVTEGLELQIEKSQVMNDSSDSAMAELKLLLDKISVDLLKAQNSGTDRSDKLSIATNLEGIRENMLDLINTRVDSEYVFAGSDTTGESYKVSSDFEATGKVTFEGDGFLREVAVQPGSYRDRGITGYDVSFYTSSKANAGESFTFEEGERIIDENGFEWKLNVAETQLQKYDYDGNIYHPLNTDATLGDVTAVNLNTSLTTTAIEAWDGITPATEPAEPQAVRATYTIDNIGSVPSSKVFEAKHNYFDDLNITINALEGRVTNLDGTVAGEVSDETVFDIIANSIEETTDQFDATNIGHGELGGRNAVFNAAYETLLTQETNYNVLIQQTGGADTAKLALELAALELTYQTLYSSISKMNDLSLLNYLR